MTEGIGEPGSSRCCRRGVSASCFYARSFIFCHPLIHLSHLKPAREDVIDEESYSDDFIDVDIE